jgi:asparagine synthase (glutamine-hydrolysing)
MCGIAGIIGSSSPEALKAMLAAMIHRGPDDEGTYSDHFLSMGMRRLAIIDLSEKGHQPMSTADQSIWIVYNGEMYNFKEEREILISSGYHFASETDTEVVLKMYLHYGESFLNRMEGMFALCIYDKRQGKGNEKILLARDHLGIKPLLYTMQNKQLIFASELKSIMKSGLVPAELDHESVSLLTIYGVVPQPYTILKNVKMLMPGHLLVWQNSKIKIRRYWSPGLKRVKGLYNTDYHEQVEKFTRLMRQTVRKHMVSDVPLGAFLSGGLDSSLLVALMKEVGGQVVTFSVGYQQEGQTIDETDDALKIARWLKTEHHRVEVTGRMVADKLDHIIQALDQPSYDGVNSYFVSMAARQSATVAISGTGGDEFFAGYPWFSILNKEFSSTVKTNLAKMAGLFPKALMGLNAYHFLKSKTGKYIEYSANWSHLLFRYFTFIALFEGNGAASMLSPEIVKSTLPHFAMNKPLFPYLDFEEGSIIERISALTMSTYCQNQLLRDIDAVSMAHSLEVRVPFITTKISDFALSLPDSSKINFSKSIRDFTAASYKDLGVKKILVDAGRSLLPPGMDKQPKRGFKMPFDWWLRSSLRDVFEDVFSEKSIENRGIYNFNYMNTLKSGFLAKKIPWTKIWLPIVLELWCRKFIDK